MKLLAKDMEAKHTAEIAIVGGGIVGLAHAYMALRKGYRVVLFDREQFAVGASVRNFGMIWPIGQEPGVGLDRALRSRQHWIELSTQADFWLSQLGSLHLAYHADEEAILKEFIHLYKNSEFDCAWVSAEEVIRRSPNVNQHGLRGGLWSSTECNVNPREAIRKLPLYLQKKFGLVLRFGHVVKEVSFPFVRTNEEVWYVSKIIVCSGADFETLYPAIYEQHEIKKCKLQMMKAMPLHPFELGPALCAGLTLRHYSAFSKCPSLPALDKRFDELDYRLKEHGIHVLLAQHEDGGLIIGDSHHYDNTIEPFDSEEVNQLILEHLATFTNMEFKITERWHGVYPKLAGKLNLMVEPEQGVTIVNALGGAGMTLSLGLAEEVIDSI